MLPRVLFLFTHRKGSNHMFEYICKQAILACRADNNSAVDLLTLGLYKGDTGFPSVFC